MKNHLLRVLWFTGVQLPAVTGQDLKRAGWQEGLRQILEAEVPEIKLGIASFGAKSYEPFTLGNSTYFNLLRRQPANRWARMYKGWSHRNYLDDDLGKCLSVVDVFKPDVIHFHGAENLFGLVSERSSIPSVLSIQGNINGYLPRYFTGQTFSELVGLVISRNFIKGEGAIHKWFAWKQYAPIERRIYSACQNFMGRTDWDRAMQQALNPKGRYFHVDEIINPLFAEHSWRDADCDPILIYSTSSNAFFKGAPILVEAVGVLKKTGFPNLHLRMAGVDPASEVGIQIRKKSKLLNLEGSIELLGRLSPEQILKEMQGAAIFVLPSHVDNSPNSLCEAMLLGMPCVGAYTGGIPTLVKTREEGLLYHNQDAYALAACLRKLLEDRSLASQLGENARRTARIRHDAKRIAKETRDIYFKISKG